MQRDPRRIEVVFGQYHAPVAHFVASSAHAGPGTITGLVTDDGGTPLSGAHVAIAGITPVRTDLQGRYKLTGVHPGPVEVAASDGILFFADSASVIVRAAETVESDFALVLKRHSEETAETAVA